MNSPPSYEEAVQHSLSNPYQPSDPEEIEAKAQVAPRTTVLNFFDTQAIPPGNILKREQVGIVSPSNASIKTNGDGDIESFDGCLDRDAKELFHYFMSYMQAPQMNVYIQGTHTERRVHTRRVNKKTKRQVRHVTVVDFNFTIDISALIDPEWSRLVCLQEGNVMDEWKQVLESYTKSNNAFKEIHMTKQPIWDYEQLKLALINCVRSTGYTHRIRVSFLPRAEKVSAFSSGFMSKMAHEKGCQWLMLLSCLCIVLCPIYYCSRR